MKNFNKIALALILTSFASFEAQAMERRSTRNHQIQGLVDAQQNPENILRKTKKQKRLHSEQAARAAEAAKKVRDEHIFITQTTLLRKERVEQIQQAERARRAEQIEQIGQVGQVEQAAPRNNTPGINKRVIPRWSSFKRRIPGIATATLSGLYAETQTLRIPINSLEFAIKAPINALTFAYGLYKTFKKSK